MLDSALTFLATALVIRGVVWALFWSLPAARLRPHVRNAWLAYWLDCTLCQVFLVAWVGLTAMHGLSVSVVLTAFAHLALAEVANRIWQRLTPPPMAQPPRRRGGCGGNG